MSFVRRTFPSYVDEHKWTPFDGRRNGWRLLVPLWVWKRREYDIWRDEFHDALWWLSLGISFEPIYSGEQRLGLSIRMTFGWAPLRAGTH